MVNIIHLNILLVIMIMILLDHYIYFFHTRLAILINLIKKKMTMSLMIKYIQLLKNYNKMWKKIMNYGKINENRL